MDSIEPEQTPFAAVSAHTSKITRVSLNSQTETYTDACAGMGSKEWLADGMNAIAISSMAR